MRMSNRLHTDDRGIAIITVALVGMVVAAMVVLLVNRSIRNANESQVERSTDEALVVAESAMNQAIYDLGQDYEYSTITGDTPAFASVDEERDWVLTKVEDESLPVTVVEDAEYVIVKPEESEVVYAVAYVPNRDNPQVTRVVKVDISPYVVESYVFFPSFGFAAGDDLTLGGDGVLGSKGGAHANGKLNKGNNKTEVSGCSSAEDDNDFEPDNPAECGPGTGVTVELPPVIAEDFHELSTHDLCKSGGFAIVKAGPATTGVPSDPCEGPVITTNPADVGWSNGGINWTYNGGSSGVFFVHGGNVNYSGDSGADGVTIIVNAVDDTECSMVGGDFGVTGNLKLFPHSSARDLAVVAERDFKQGGNSNIFGIVLAGEQVDIGGTPGVNNAVIAVSPCHTPGSPVDENKLRGAASLTYDGGLEAPIYGRPKTTAGVLIDRWSEL